MHWLVRIIKLTEAIIRISRRAEGFALKTKELVWRRTPDFLSFSFISCRRHTFSTGITCCTRDYNVFNVNHLAESRSKSLIISMSSIWFDIPSRAFAYSQRNSFNRMQTALNNAYITTHNLLNASSSIRAWNSNAIDGSNFHINYFRSLLYHQQASQPACKIKERSLGVHKFRLFAFLRRHFLAPARKFCFVLVMLWSDYVNWDADDEERNA